MDTHSRVRDEGSACHGPLCPGCGGVVDPLRAGHVSIIASQFFYFCASSCKVAYDRSLSGVSQDDVVTLPPPPVAPDMFYVHAAPGPTDVPLATIARSFDGVRTPPSVADVLKFREQEAVRISIKPETLSPTVFSILSIVFGAAGFGLAHLSPWVDLSLAVISLALLIHLSAIFVSRAETTPGQRWVACAPYVGAVIGAFVARFQARLHGADVVSFAGISIALAGTLNVLSPDVFFRKSAGGESSTPAGFITHAGDERGDASILNFTRAAVAWGALASAALAAIVTLGSHGSVHDLIARASAASIAIGGVGAVRIVGWYYRRTLAEARLQGIHFKDGSSFHRAASADVAIFASRRTLLQSAPEVVEVEPLGQWDTDGVLSSAGSVEEECEHPIAHAIVRSARARNVDFDNVQNARNYPGLGRGGSTSLGQSIIVGNRAFLLRENVSVAIADEGARAFETAGRTVVFLAVAGKVVGTIALQDALQPGARAAAQNLLKSKVEPVLMSGGSRDTCASLARAIGVEHIRPEVLPASKGSEVIALREGGHVVAAIGHPGVDDEALHAADVSVALSPKPRSPWAVVIDSGDVRDGARALILAKTCESQCRVALGLCVGPAALAACVVAFGMAPLIFAPVGALAGFAAAMMHAKHVAR